MSTASDVQLLRRFNGSSFLTSGLTDGIPFKDEISRTNSFNLVPIPPAFIRDARYQGDAR